MLDSVQHTLAHRLTQLITVALLVTSGGPILGRCLVVGGNKAENRLHLVLVLMVCLHAYDHSRFVEKRHVIDNPWYPANLSTDLRYYFADNGLEILAVVNCTRKHYLRNDRDFFK